MQAITKVKATITFEVVQDDKVTASTTVYRDINVGVFTSDRDASKEAAARSVDRYISEPIKDALVAVLAAVGDKEQDNQ